MGDPTKLYPIACNKIRFPKQHAFEERRGWQIHLFAYPFKQKVYFQSMERNWASEMMGKARFLNV